MRSVLRCMEVLAVPVLQDNFAYLLIDTATATCAAVDPAEPQKVVDVAKKRNLNISFVLTTHHHWDHAGGNEEMLGLIGKVPVYGGDERIQAVSHLLKDRDVVTLGDITITTRTSPCHTTGHVLYHCRTPSSPTAALFTGDTLFVGGCGRFFEGTAEQMNYALNSLVSDLPDDTLVYCGHEYALNNLGFAMHVEPNNEQLQAKVAAVKTTLAAGGHSIPSTVGEERQYNPFMRLHSPEIRATLGLGPNTPAVEVMAKLRELKNHWKG